jgi:hypothetical protein
LSTNETSSTRRWPSASIYFSSPLEVDMCPERPVAVPSVQ